MHQMPTPTQELIDHANTVSTYAMWSVFKVTAPLPAERDQIIDELEEALGTIDMTIRGWYDVAGYRADADVMVWWHGDSPEKLQDAYHQVMNSGLPLEGVWSAMSVSMASEFNKQHIPGFLIESEAPKYAAVYPFVRSYDWYFMDPKERARILRNHGAAGTTYKDVVASTLAAFALGDYEWIVCAEADELDRIVQMMRDFRNTEARLYIRQDTPFFTGPRVSLHKWAARQR